MPYSEENEQRRLFSKYLGQEIKYTTESLGVSPDFSEPIPDVVSSLSGLINAKNHDSTEIVTDTSSLSFGKKLLEIMKASTQANHMVGDDSSLVPGSAFPFCHFDRQTKENSGKKCD